MADALPLHSHQVPLGTPKRSASACVIPERENGYCTPKEVVIVGPLDDENGEQETPSVKLHGVVDKIVLSSDPSQPEKAQIVIQEAEDLYKEIRIDNRAS